MEVLPKDPWGLLRRRASVAYAICALLALTEYAYRNRIAPVSCVVSFAILGLTLAAFLLLAGTSGQTRTDPDNALAFLLIALAFLMDGIFIAGAAAFGPARTVDVGVSDWVPEPDVAYFWSDGGWFEAELPKDMSEDDHRKFEAWSQNLALTNDIDSRPGRIQISLWNRQVYQVMMKNWTPPTTFGEPPSPVNARAFLELLCGLGLLAYSLILWRSGQRQGIRYRRSLPLLSQIDLSAESQNIPRG